MRRLATAGYLVRPKPVLTAGTLSGHAVCPRRPDTGRLRHDQTVGRYETAIERLRETKVPKSRQDALVGACDAVQSALLDDELVSTDDLLVLTAVAAEAINDVREAKTVGVEADLPVDHQYEISVPIEEYVVTTAEREEALAVLSNLILLAVDTDGEYTAAAASGD